MIVLAFSFLPAVGFSLRSSTRTVTTSFPSFPVDWAGVVEEYVYDRGTTMVRAVLRLMTASLCCSAISSLTEREEVLLTLQ